jgi:hypothetical protein
MRASNSFRLAALTLAVAFAGGSLALAQCPNCDPSSNGGSIGYGHYNARIGEYSRYGGFDANAYYRRGTVCGPYSDAGDCIYRHYPQTDLFHQYYVGNNCGGAPAAMYPAPNTGIPPWVGHVYYTYEPLYPHEFLYPHHRTYHRYYDDGRGLTRTHVSWNSSHFVSALKVIPFALP